MPSELCRQAGRLRQADRYNAFVAVRPDPPHTHPGNLGNALMAVKDNIGVAGLPFTAGLPMFRERMAASDAEAVRRMRAAGARVAGVAATDAGGFGVTTPAVVNPLWPGLVAGGSSGGPAAAVAAGLTAIGLGTDTGGSVRIPAACCNLFAFKPSHGRVPLDGIWPMAPGFDHAGLMTRDYGMLVAAAYVLLGEARQARAGRPRFGFDPGRVSRLAPDIRVGFLEALDWARKAGFEVRPLALPGWELVSRVHGMLVLAQARAVYASLWPDGSAALGETAWQALRLANRLDAAMVARARQEAARIAGQIGRCLAHVDAILAPTLPIAPPQVGEHRTMLGGREVPVVAAMVAETCIANLTGCPALALPLGVAAGDKPVSMQMMGALGRDEELLQYGACFGPVFSEAEAAKRPL